MAGFLLNLGQQALPLVSYPQNHWRDCGLSCDRVFIDKKPSDVPDLITVLWQQELCREGPAADGAPTLPVFANEQLAVRPRLDSPLPIAISPWDSFGNPEPAQPTTISVPKSPAMPMGCITTLNVLGHVVLGNRVYLQASYGGLRPQSPHLIAESRMLRTTKRLYSFGDSKVTRVPRQLLRCAGGHRLHLPRYALLSRPTQTAGVVANATRSRRRRRKPPEFLLRHFPLGRCCRQASNHMLHVPVVPPETLLAARRMGSFEGRRQGSPSGASSECPLQRQH